jgi:uncharacterized protein
MSLLERLTSVGPKRVLSLDGGGIRGLITLGFLERLEQLLRLRHGQPDLRLSDYFDLIGGTSTGAIIAGALALGMAVSEIKARYLELGGKIFGKRTWRRWHTLFDVGPLEDELQKTFGDLRLGDERIKTGLSITVKRADTGQTWLMDNHPLGNFFEMTKDVPLWQAIRASTAAPMYFAPEQFEIGKEVATFVDGGVSMANNPAFHLFSLATLQGFPYRWPRGENNLLLVSVGTGSWHRQASSESVLKNKLWDWLQDLPLMLMEDANWHNQLILQGLSHTPTPWKIYGVGNLVHDLFGSEPSLHYLRYDALLEEEALAALGLEQLVSKVASLRDMSIADNRFDLALIGERAAPSAVLAEHFPAVFDLVNLQPAESLYAEFMARIYPSELTENASSKSI